MNFLSLVRTFQYQNDFFDVNLQTSYRFYHLDVCLTILDENNGFYFPDAFDPITRHNMNNELNLIPVFSLFNFLFLKNFYFF